MDLRELRLYRGKAPALARDLAVDLAGQQLAPVEEVGTGEGVGSGLRGSRALALPADLQHVGRRQRGGRHGDRQVPCSGPAAPRADTCSSLAASSTTGGDCATACSVLMLTCSGELLGRGTAPAPCVGGVTSTCAVAVYLCPECTAYPAAAMAPRTVSTTIKSRVAPDNQPVVAEVERARLAAEVVELRLSCGHRAIPS